MSNLVTPPNPPRRRPEVGDVIEVTSDLFTWGPARVTAVSGVQTEVIYGKFEAGATFCASLEGAFWRWAGDVPSVQDDEVAL